LTELKIHFRYLLIPSKLHEDDFLHKWNLSENIPSKDYGTGHKIASRHRFLFGELSSQKACFLDVLFYLWLLDKKRKMDGEKINDVMNSIKPGGLKFFLDELLLSSYTANYEPIDRKRFSQDLNKLVVVQLSCGGEATGTSIKT
jgi:hypothetical protein